MLRFLIRIIINAVGIYIASGIIPGFVFKGILPQLGLVALIFTLINLIFGGILKFIFRPLIFLSLGLLALLINMGLLWITDQIAESIEISSLTALVLGTLLLTVLNLIPLKRK